MGLGSRNVEKNSLLASFAAAQPETVAIATDQEQHQLLKRQSHPGLPHLQSPPFFLEGSSYLYKERVPVPLRRNRFAHPNCGLPLKSLVFS